MSQKRKLRAIAWVMSIAAAAAVVAEMKIREIAERAID